MQKIVLFGKSQQQNATPQPSSKHSCSNCLKLQSQLSDLNVLLSQKEEDIQRLFEASQNEIVKQIQSELIDLKEKYGILKKKIRQIEKENDDLFLENTILEKQLTSCKNQLREFTEEKTVSKLELNKRVKTNEEKVHEKSIVYERQDKQTKELQVELFVYKEKVSTLEILIKTQSDELVKLREFLRKRNSLQSQRHKILQQLVF